MEKNAEITNETPNDQQCPDDEKTASIDTAKDHLALRAAEKVSECCGGHCKNEGK